MTRIASKRTWIILGMVALFFAVGFHATPSEPGAEKSYYAVMGAGDGSGCSSTAPTAKLTDQPGSPDTSTTTLATGDFLLAGLLCAALAYGHRHNKH